MLAPITLDILSVSFCVCALSPCRAAEYDEMRLKACALLRAVGVAEAGGAEDARPAQVFED